MQERADPAGVVSLPSVSRTVDHFRHVVLWPLQILATHEGSANRLCSTELTKSGLWSLLDDEFGSGDGEFQERHYREFVSFLPHVQRFLYGDAPGPVRELGYGVAPLRVFRRNDVTHVRVTMEPTSAPITLEVAHIDLYTFHDIDAVILACEIVGTWLPLDVAQNVMNRLGRAYPSGWDDDGTALHCPAKVEWLGKHEKVLSTSDYEDRRHFLDQTGLKRAPHIATHWEWLLAPLAHHASESTCPLRFREIEYYRMPIMSFVSFDDLDVLTEADYKRLALGLAPGQPNQHPYAEQFPPDFTRDYCLDRFFTSQRRPGLVRTRFMSCGHAFTMVTEGRTAFVVDNERGLLGQFRHQYFLLFLIAHFHKAALLMISDRLVSAIKRLDPGEHRSIVAFRRATYALQEVFMSFTQRYWFNEVSDQPQARELFAMHKRHLGTSALYAEVRSEIFDMVTYLDSDLLRRQSGSMHRLTVVTILGLIGTTVTGFLGMNLLAEAESPLETKLTYFAVTTFIVSGLALLTVITSRAMTRFFDRIAGE